MNQIEIGKFIAKCRKEKKLTQAQLAEKLNITDRAVSKWETGKSMPDSSIMLELCEILGITVNELLSGEEINMENLKKKADENLIALKRKEENYIAKNVVISILFSATLFIGIMVCLICNIAISGDFTWSLLPVSSIVFAWVIIFPSIILGKRGIIISFLSLSVFLVPYLFLLSNLINVKEVFSVGAVLAVAAVDRFHVDHGSSLSSFQKNKQIGCISNYFFIDNSIYVSYQYNVIKNDSRAYS